MTSAPIARSAGRDHGCPRYRGKFTQEIGCTLNGGQLPSGTGRATAGRLTQGTGEPSSLEAEPFSQRQEVGLLEPGVRPTVFTDEVCWIGVLDQ